MPNSTALLFFGCCLALASTLPAQCATAWKSGQPAPGPAYNGGVAATTWWDPDGAGPRQAVLVVGGYFTIPSAGANHLATWDPATGDWAAFAAQPNQVVQTVAVLANGQLAIGGGFTAIGNTPANCVAIFDGTNWSCPGGGIDNGNVLTNGVFVLQPLPQGDFVVGGAFVRAGTVAANGLARWDGSQWHAFGGFQGTVEHIARRPNGNLIVAGAFPPIGFPGYANIAEWNGTQWLHYSTGLGSNYSYVTALALLQNGDVIASGFFTNAGSLQVPRIARWNGTAWTQLGSGFDGMPSCFLELGNGELLAGNVNTINSGPVYGVARWDGSQWSAFAPNIEAVSLSLLPNGQLLAAGNLPTTSTRMPGLFVWDQQTWQPTNHGFDGAVRALLPMPNGDLVALGDFLRTPGRDATAIARSTGADWWPMAVYGSPGQMTSASCGTVDANGTVWVGSANGSTVQRWSGSSWQTVGGQLRAATLLAVGNRLLGGAASVGYGSGSVYEWTGQQWQGLGAPLDGPCYALLQRRNGDLIAGGNFLNAGTMPVSRIARWDGTAWHAFGPGVDGAVRALAELPNGDLVIAGEFITDGLRPLNLVARWDGSAWLPLGAGFGGNPGVAVHSLLVLPNGDLLAGGDFRTAGGYPTRGIARWDGTRWNEVDGSLDGAVFTMAQLANGEVVVGGNFRTAGGRPAAHFSRLRSTCPASATSYGAGCAGSAGLVNLEADRQPWLGSTYRATCYGASAQSVGLDLFGLAPQQVALSTLHPTAGSTCQLLTQPDAATLRLPTQGTIASSFTLPNDPALAGQALYHQMLVADFDTAMSVTSLASSNAVRLTIGAF